MTTRNRFQFDADPWDAYGMAVRTTAAKGALINLMIWGAPNECKSFYDARGARVVVAPSPEEAPELYTGLLYRDE